MSPCVAGRLGHAQPSDAPTSAPKPTGPARLPLHARRPAQPGGRRLPARHPPGPAGAGHPGGQGGDGRGRGRSRSRGGRGRVRRHGTGWGADALGSRGMTRWPATGSYTPKFPSPCVYPNLEISSAKLPRKQMWNRDSFTPLRKQLRSAHGCSGSTPPHRIASSLPSQRPTASLRG